MTKFILIGLLLFSTAAHALPNACDAKLSLHQILDTAREVVLRIPVQARVHLSNPDKDYFGTTMVQIRMKRVDLGGPVVRDGVEVAYETHWGTSSIPYPKYLEATEPTSKVRLTLVVPYPDPMKPDIFAGITAEFEGNIVRIVDYFAYLAESSTSLNKQSESCITTINTIVIK